MGRGDALKLRKGDIKREKDEKGAENYQTNNKLSTSLSHKYVIEKKIRNVNTLREGKKTFIIRFNNKKERLVWQIIIMKED